MCVLGTVAGGVSHSMLRGRGCAPRLEEFPVKEDYKSLQVSAVNGEGGCRRRACRVGTCVCCSF